MKPGQKSLVLLDFDLNIILSYKGEIYKGESERTDSYLSIKIIVHL